MALVVGFLLNVAVAGCDGNDPPDSPTTPKKVNTSTTLNSTPSTYVGSAACIQCHRKQADQWAGSHHERAMQQATQDTVLGDFQNSHFEYGGVTSIFFRKGDQFFVRTDGPNGEMKDFEIAYTFGVDPLQQYLVTFPDGRFQALGIAWDTRSKKDGGQRWFHLYPDESILHNDPLHWTGPNQTWNYMCADCHSTNIKKHYSLSKNQYKTTWSEINVGCESCHGPRSHHVSWANRHSIDPANPPSSPAEPSTAAEEIKICAKCHARRSILAEGFRPEDSFLNHYMPALLDTGLYYPDGQVLDEVYVFGSFLQSKMYQRGVRCTDCHSPHTNHLRKPGNATCTACHRETPPSRFPTMKAKTYDSPQHHFHPKDSSGAKCVSCHMPSKRFMVIDERHDHSFRIPRPDLTATLGVPNACNACHSKETAQWAADRIVQWYGHQPKEHFAHAFHGSRQGTLDAEESLSRLSLNEETSNIIRATALSQLRNYDRPFSMEAIEAGLQSGDALVRIGALRGAERLRPQIRWQMAHRLLTDSERAVRIEAARLLAPVDRRSLTPDQKKELDKAVLEYITAQMVNDDRPEAHTNIGVIYSQSAKFSKAEQAYQQAISLDPHWVPALVNLADLYRAQGRDAKGEKYLQRALESAPEDPDVHHAYGLWLTRQGRSQEAIASFERAFRLAPQSARYAYVYGIGLNSTGKTSDALNILKNAQTQFPDNLDILYALLTIQRDQGNMKEALAYAKQLASLRPDQEYFQELVKELGSHQPE